MDITKNKCNSTVILFRYLTFQKSCLPCGTKKTGLPVETGRPFTIA